METEIKKLKNILKTVSGVDAIINVYHKLYGKQTIQCRLNPITDSRVGFKVKSQEIYINENDINKIDIGSEIYFADEVMEIKIVI